jgi:sarcosine oxidase subunit delta
MLEIPCPHCGPRDEPEFTCGGESHIVRPGPEVDAAGWADYLFFRTNPKGVQFERWHHSFGCGEWFNVARDTATHRIHAAYPMAGAKPQVAS